MPDVKSAAALPSASALYLRDEELKQAVDLLFFVARDVSAPGEAELRSAGLGHAHHRALYFIARRPDLTVAELIATLRVSKQSLNRVLNDLITGGYVARHPAPQDRRMRRLSLTARGRALENALWAAQRPLLDRAFRNAGPEAVTGFRNILRALTDHGQQEGATTA